MIYYKFIYRPLMKLMHRFNLHYAPPCYPDGDTLLWCQWCGLRYVSHRHDFVSPLNDCPNVTKESI